jgi:pimeloyl-ACP methyl ester carboxylesterase
MALDGFEEGFVLGADGNRIAYLLHDGHAKKPAIVFVHGLGADALSFKPQLEHFCARGFTVLAYDLRGHGKSEASTWPGFYNFDALARDLRAIIKSLIPHKPIVLAGHCIGGAIVMIYEEFYPGESQRLFLLSTTANHKRSPLGIILRLYLRLTPSRYFHKRDRTDRPYRTYQDPVVHDTTFRKQLRAISATNPINYGGLLLQFCNFDMRDELSGFKSPVTIVVGEFDSIFPIEHSVFLNEGIEGSELIILRGKNHLLPLNASEELNALIEERI